jgi:hypothetical protein
MVGHGGIWAGILGTWSSISVAVTVRKSSRRRTGRYHFALPLIGPLAQMDQRRSRPVGLIKTPRPFIGCLFSRGRYLSRLGQAASPHGGSDRLIARLDAAGHEG